MFVFVASEDEDVNERIVKVYNTCKNETSLCTAVKKLKNIFLTANPESSF